MPYVIKSEENYTKKDGTPITSVNYFYHVLGGMFNSWGTELPKAKKYKTHTQALKEGRRLGLMPREGVEIEQVPA